MTSAYLYDVCLPVWRLPTCTMSGCIMSFYLCYDDCSTEWRLPICMMPASLYSSMSGFLYLNMISCDLYNMISCCLNKISMPVCFLPLYMMSGYFTNVAWLPPYYVGLPLWYLPTCSSSAYLYYVCSAVWCLPTCMAFAYSIMSVYLYHVCLPVLCLINCVMSAYLYYVWLLTGIP
jgi:hypothetical protein